jgi:hypothetical protein
LVTHRLSDEARRAVLARAEPLDAARALVPKLTDDQCAILYVEIEARLARNETAALAKMLPASSTSAETSVFLQLAGLPFAEARRQAMATFKRAYLSRLMELSKHSVTIAARRAVVDRTNFRRLLQQSGLRERGTKPKTTGVTKYTERILRILDEDKHGLRAYEIAAKTKQTVNNVCGILKSLERQGRIVRHGTHRSTLWTLPGVSPEQRIETVPAAVVAVLAKAAAPMDGRQLCEAIVTTLVRNTGKKPSAPSLRRAINRLISCGMIRSHGANEHGALYVLAPKGETADLN